MHEHANFDNYYTIGDKPLSFDNIEIVIITIGVIVMLIGMIGTTWTFFHTRKYRHELKDQLQRLQDFEIKGPACDLKSRLIGVQAQMNWKDYFTAPEPITPKKRKSKLSKVVI